MAWPTKGRSRESSIARSAITEAGVVVGKTNVKKIFWILLATPLGVGVVAGLVPLRKGGEAVSRDDGTPLGEALGKGLFPPRSDEEADYSEWRARLIEGQVSALFRADS